MKTFCHCQEKVYRICHSSFPPIWHAPRSSLVANEDGPRLPRQPRFATLMQPICDLNHFETFLATSSLESFQNYIYGRCLPWPRRDLALYYSFSGPVHGIQCLHIPCRIVDIDVSAWGSSYRKAIHNSFMRLVHCGAVSLFRQFRT